MIHWLCNCIFHAGDAEKPVPAEELAAQSEEPLPEEATEEAVDSLVKSPNKQTASKRGSAPRSLTASSVPKNQVCHTPPHLPEQSTAKLRSDK